MSVTSCPWPSKEIRNLIALISQNNHLYNIDNPEYSIRASVDAAWANISNSLVKPVHECRDKWYNLRTVYRRQLREAHTAFLKTGRVKVQRWIWKDAMSFLLPYLRQTGAIPYLTTAMTELQNQKINQNPESPMPAGEQSEAIRSESLPQVKFEAVDVDLEDFGEYSPPSKRHCSDDDDDDISNDPLVRDSLSPWEQPSISVNSAPMDADEMFLRSLIPDMKSLTPRKKAIFRMNVQQALFDCMFSDENKKK